MDNVGGLLDAQVFEEGTLARVRWRVGFGHTNGRTIGLAGWNLPLARPTGLGAAGHTALGALLRERLTAVSRLGGP